MQQPRKNDTEMVAHARRELELAGLFTVNEEQGYDGFIGKASLALVKLFDQWTDNDPNKMSAINSVFGFLIGGELLSPPTNDPSEWEDVEVEGQTVRRNKRSMYFITRDEGKTWFNLRTEQKGICNDIKTGKPVEGVEDPNGTTDEDKESTANTSNGGDGVDARTATSEKATVSEGSQALEEGELDGRVEQKSSPKKGSSKAPSEKPKSGKA